MATAKAHHEERCSLITRIVIFALLLAAANLTHIIKNLMEELVVYFLLDIVFKGFFDSEIKAFFRRSVVIRDAQSPMSISTPASTVFSVESSTILPSLNSQIKKSIEDQKMDVAKRLADKEASKRSEILRKESERLDRKEAERHQKELIDSLIRSGSVVEIGGKRRPSRKKLAVGSRLAPLKITTKKSS